MRIIITYFTFIMLVLLSSRCTTQDACVYVSPYGNDANEGSIDYPVRTIAKAKEYVRILKKDGHKAINVYMRGGDYTLFETLVFNIEDSGSNSKSITYQAYNDEKVTVTSSLKLEGWKKAMNLPDNFPDNTYDDIWVHDLSVGAYIPKYLYKGDKVLPRSKTDSFVPYSPFSELEGGQKNRRQIQMPEGVIKDWNYAGDMELAIFSSSRSTRYNLPIIKVDELNSLLITSVPAAYALGFQKDDVYDARKTAWLSNCPEGMLKEGHWYVSSKEQKIYLVSHLEPKDITMPQLKEYIRVEGLVGKKVDQDIPVTNINFKGLIFSGGERDTWGRRHQKNHISHEWERYDQADAMLRFRGAKNCNVSDCQFINSGGGGVRMDLYCQNITVENGYFEHLGAHGIFLCGYGVGYKDLNKNNVIRNNYMAYVGEAYQHSAAITIFQSGSNHIVNNTIQHTPFHSILLSGS